jgi:L-amino acid N-acyltransferase YncA
MKLGVVDAEPAHVAAVQAIYAHWVVNGLASFEEVPPDPADMDFWRRALQDAGLPYLVAIADDQVLGFAYASPYRLRSGYRYTVEDSVYIAPVAKGRGVGRALLGAVIGRAEARGLRQMLAVIGDSANAASIGLHRSLGFRQAGLLPSVGFKFGRWVDSVIMQRALGPGDAELPEKDQAVARS